MPTKCIVCKIIRATYGIPGQSAKYCAKCKSNDMKDLKHKKCMTCNEIRASHAFPGQKPEYCANCALENMENVVNAKCKGCHKTEPSYGFLGKAREYCVQCKLPGMVDIASKKCIICKETNASFGLPGKKREYCGKCKPDGMDNLANKKCIKCNLISATFGFLGKSAEYCKKCKLAGMEDLVHLRCIICKINRARCGYFGGKAEYCNQCKKEDMQDLEHPMCKNAWCSTFANPKYDGYCAYCYTNMFPDKQISRNYKTKELSIFQYIKTEFPNLDIIHDKTITGGCSKRRPDIYIDLGYQVLIVEIDENQHTDYDCSCENKRIMELSKDVQHRPIVFIRFNPDDYTKGNQNITSCWTNNTTTGTHTIKKSKQKEWSERLKTLKDTMQYWLDPNHTTNKIIEIIHLYYDE